MPTPTQRTKLHFEKLGYIVGTVERVNSWAGPPDKKCPACGKNMIGIRQDLFNFADLMAFQPEGDTTVLIQCTSGTNHSHRRVKIMANPTAKLWLSGRNREIVLVSFDKNKKSNRYEVRVENIFLSDFQAGDEF